MAENQRGARSAIGQQDGAAAVWQAPTQLEMLLSGGSGTGRLNSATSARSCEVVLPLHFQCRRQRPACLPARCPPPLHATCPQATPNDRTSATIQCAHYHRPAPHKLTCMPTATCIHPTTR